MPDYDIPDLQISSEWLEYEKMSFHDRKAYRIAHGAPQRYKGKRNSWRK